MEDKNVKAVERIQEEIKKITEGKKRVLFSTFFFSLWSPGMCIIGYTV